MPPAAPVVLPAAQAPDANADAFDQSTPESALRSFVRAFNDNRWDVIVHFIPSKTEITAEQLEQGFTAVERERLARMVREIESALARERIQTDGSRATFVYGSGAVKLVEENGLWKIEDL
jgi:hypothetical protein